MRVLIGYYFKHFDLDRFLQLSIYFIIRLQYHRWCILYEISRYTVSPLFSCVMANCNFLHNSFPLTVISPGDIAPRLSPSKFVLIRDMIESKYFTMSEMAEQAECSKQTIISICNNLRQFGSLYILQTRVGRKTNCDTLDD